MPRSARVAPANCFFHIINHAAGKQDIFRDAKDYERFLNYLADYNKQFDWLIYTYTLIPNHFHLQVQSKSDPLGEIMKALQTAYGVYFNKKYERIGPVFRSRYRSVICQDGKYFLSLSRYIHRNSTEAGLTERPQDYPYSSYREYVTGFKEHRGIVDLRAARRVIGGFSAQEINAYREFVESNSSGFIPYEPRRGLFGSSFFRSRWEERG